MAAAIEAEGLKTHVYTSPHLVRFNERIRLSGSLIEDDYLAALLARVLDISEDINPSFFEATTAAAMIAFADIPADACILEVGLGGRLDATNVVDKPVATGIAALGIDHESFLLSPEPAAPSEPIVRIAWEKAGIAKSGVPLLTQKYAADMDEIIHQHCELTEAVHLPRGDIWNAAIYKNQLHYRDEQGKLAMPLPALPGAFQADNAALAIAMLRHQDEIAISDGAFRAAMGWVKWPGRLQKLGPGPLSAILPDTEIWLDGGHNSNAGEALADFVKDLGKETHLIIAMLSNKDPEALLHWIDGDLESVTVVPVPGHEFHDRKAFGRAHMNISEAPDITGALRKLSDQNPEAVLIAGTLYLAGEVLRANGQLPD